MKRNLLIFLCMVNTFITVYSQDNVLNSTKLKEFVFSNAPKEWFRYITNSTNSTNLMHNCKNTNVV